MVAFGDSFAKETSRLNGSSRIELILCFSSLKDSGLKELVGGEVELEQLVSHPARVSIQTHALTRERREKQFVTLSRSRTSTYFSIMITGNPACDSWRACSSAALRLEKFPN